MNVNAMEPSRTRAEVLCREFQRHVQQRATVTVEWLRAGVPEDVVEAFRIEQDRDKVWLDPGLVERWFAQLSTTRAQLRLDGLAYRSVASLLFSPPGYRWREAAELHIRSELEQGLDEDYVRAFQAAHAILESHRLDQCVLARQPNAAAALAEWTRVELEEHPAFETYPRAAVVMGRANLPGDLAQPAFDEFVDCFGVDEAAELTSLLSEYVTLVPDDVDRMVDLTHLLVFQAYPEAMGLSLDDGDWSQDEIWPFQLCPRDIGMTSWDDLERFAVASLARFSGEAGLDFGDALLFGLSEDAPDGPRVGTWSRSGVISADVVGIFLAAGEQQILEDRGWQPYANDPGSLHKVVPTTQASKLASEIVWILRDHAHLESPADLSLWARGPAADVAEEFGWPMTERRPPTVDRGVVSPDTWEELVSLVRSSLRNVLGGDPDEYEPGRFVIGIDDLEILVITSEETFPAIRFEHRVMAVPTTLRGEVVEFANSLHGRTSTMGAHWWVGDAYMWQQAVLWAESFYEGIFRDHLTTFIDIAYERTPEIRSRLGAS